MDRLGVSIDAWVRGLPEAEAAGNSERLAMLRSWNRKTGGGSVLERDLRTFCDSRLLASGVTFASVPFLRGSDTEATKVNSDCGGFIVTSVNDGKQT